MPPTFTGTASAMTGGRLTPIPLSWALFFPDYPTMGVAFRRLADTSHLLELYYYNYDNTNYNNYKYNYNNYYSWGSYIVF